MSSAAEKPTSKRGGDLSHRLRVEKGSRQLDAEKNPCIKVKSSATKLILNETHINKPAEVTGKECVKLDLIVMQIHGSFLYYHAKPVLLILW